MYSYKDLTIIIPTTLNNLDSKWIDQINNYSLIGIKIIISITPNLSINDAYGLGFRSDIKIIKCKQKGQVKQRQYAYKFCESSLIMHMDDDIFFSIKSLKKLIEEFSNLNPNSCIAPRINNKKKLSDKNIFKRLKNLILFFQLNPTPGSISITSFPVEHRIEEDDYEKYQRVDWLPGGLLIIRKTDTINHNYYKFKGKAYCEDLIHSFLLKKKGIDLYISNKCFCETALFPYKNPGPFNFLNFLLNDFNARNYFRKLSNKPLLPMIIVYIFLLFNYLFFKLQKLFK